MVSGSVWHPFFKPHFILHNGLFPNFLTYDLFQHRACFEIETNLRRTNEYDSFLPVPPNLILYVFGSNDGTDGSVLSSAVYLMVTRITSHYKSSFYTIWKYSHIIDREIYRLIITSKTKSGY